MEILKEFKNGSLRILVSSDVAARGLDIAGLTTVVSFELARDLDSHVHRIGRVGRKGQKHEGTAYTLLSVNLQTAPLPPVFTLGTVFRGFLVY